MPNIAVIADANTALPFKAIGAAIFEVDNQQEAEESLKRIITEQFALVFIAENLHDFLKKILDDNPSLVYLIIPPVREAKGLASKVFEDIVQKTVGIKH